MPFMKKDFDVLILKRMRDFELDITSVVLSSKSLSRRAATSVKEGLSSGLCIQLWHIISYLWRKTEKDKYTCKIETNRQSNK